MSGGPFRTDVGKRERTHAGHLGSDLIDTRHLDALGWASVVGGRNWRVMGDLFTLYIPEKNQLSDVQTGVWVLRDRTKNTTMSSLSAVSGLPPAPF